MISVVCVGKEVASLPTCAYPTTVSQDSKHHFSLCNFVRMWIAVSIVSCASNRRLLISQYGINGINE